MIKNYRQYVNESAGVELTKEQKNWLDKCTEGTWRVNPQTGEVDVQGDFECRHSNLDSFKLVRFGHVSGSFSCSSNKLTSLKGFPMEIKGGIDLEPNPIWKEIEPMVSGMSDDEKRFFYKFAAVDQTGTAESLERIARSIERMRMI